MATATAPTAVSIVTEGMKAAGMRTLSASDISRARDEWLQEIFNDIWMSFESSGNTRLKTLQTTAIAIGVDNQRQYDLPVDFDEELVVNILDGDDTGTSQGGTSSTVTLESGEDISQSDAEGRYILMTGGTSKGQYRQCVSYNTTSLAATIDRNWDDGKTPAGGDTYLVVKQHHLIEEIGISELDEILEPTVPGLPTTFAKFGDQFFFERPLDKATYGLRLRYYANIHKLDLAESSSALITKIYTNWQQVLKTGIKMKAESNMKAAEFSQTQALYFRLVSNLINKEIPYGGELTQLTM